MVKFILNPYWIYIEVPQWNVFIFIYFMWGLSEVLISYELIEYNEESSDDIEDSDKNDDTIEEDTLMHIYFNQ